MSAPKGSGTVHHPPGIHPVYNRRYNATDAGNQLEDFSPIIAGTRLDQIAGSSQLSLDVKAVRRIIPIARVRNGASKFGL